jgi:hypothetical protein
MPLAALHTTPESNLRTTAVDDLHPGGTRFDLVPVAAVVTEAIS